MIVDSFGLGCCQGVVLLIHSCSRSRQGRSLISSCISKYSLRVNAGPLMRFSRICFKVAGGSIHDIIIVFVDDSCNYFGPEGSQCVQHLMILANSFGGLFGEAAPCPERCVPHNSAQNKDFGLGTETQALQLVGSRGSVGFARHEGPRFSWRRGYVWRLARLRRHLRSNVVRLRDRRHSE
jgi:hypothetical protein